MNRTYRLVFNTRIGVWQAVSETARGRAKGGGLVRVKRGTLAAAVMAALAAGAPAAAGAQSRYTGTYNWVSSDLTIGTGGLYSAISGAATGINANGTLGTLTNSGTIGGSSHSVYNRNTSSISLVFNSGTVIGEIANDGWIHMLSNNGWILRLSNNGTVTDIANYGTIIAIGNSGTIGTLTNASGGIIGGASGVVHNSGMIGTLTNGGAISGGGIQNSGGTIGTLTNDGVIIGNSSASINNNNGGIIGTLVNAIGGTIGRASGIYNIGTIGVLVNNGTISSVTNDAIFGTTNTFGTIGTLINASGGVISRHLYGINNSGGVINMLANAGGGTISGSQYGINNEGIIGTLTNASGGSISGNGSGISNLGGTIGTLANSGTISGTISSNANGIYNNGTIGVLANASGGTISGNASGIYNIGIIGALTNTGAILGGTYGIKILFTIDTLTNTSGGTISGNASGIYNFGTIGALANSGAINGGSYGINNNGNTIGALVNASGGTISGNASGIYNSSTIGVLTNGGAINGVHASGIYNASFSTINTLINASGGTLSGSGSGISNNNGGIINTLINASGGTISGGEYDIYNYNGAFIGTLVNAGGGVISGGSTGVYNNNGTIGVLINSGNINSTNGIQNKSGTIGTLFNASGGTIGGGIFNDSGGTIGTLLNASGGVINSGIANSGGTIGVLSNSGTIGGATGINNYSGGIINTLINASGGTISGSLYALDNAGTLGPVTNTGVIAGNILSTSGNDLTINGGSGPVLGILTGYGDASGTGTQGTITNTSSNVVFASGSQLLNDAINVGSYAVNNTGAVLQVNRPVTITGNYNQSAGAALQIGVQSGAVTQGVIVGDSGYGRLVVTGNTTIAPGASVILQPNGYALAAGQRYVVVDTAGTAKYGGVTTASASGTAVTGLTYGMNGYTGTVTGASVTNGANKDLVLTVVSAAKVGAGAPQNVSSAANVGPAVMGLLGYTGISNGNLLNLYDAALGAMAEGGSAAAGNIGQQLSAMQTRLGASAPTYDALGVIDTHVNARRAAELDGSGIATGESPAQWNAWGQAFGGHAYQGARDGLDGYGADYGGLLMGVDRTVGDRWRVGGALSYSNSRVSDAGASAGDTAWVNGYGLIGYAGYTGDPWYANVSAGVVRQVYDTTRQINIASVSGTATGRYSGQQYVLSVQGGWPLHWAGSGMTVTPLAGLTYSHLNQGGYTESGGNGAALTVNASHMNSVRSNVGVKLEKAYATSFGTLIPQLQVQWLHEYDGARAVTAASFAGDTTGQTAFTTLGPTPVADLADVSLGVTLLRANNLSLSVRYEVQAARGFVSQTGSLRLAMRF